MFCGISIILSVDIDNWLNNWSFYLLAHLSYAQDELLWSLLVHRLSVRASVHLLTFSNDFSSEATEPILLKFHMEPP